MSVSLAQARPPFVEFKRVAKHDPKRSEELGHRVTKDVDMAFIMQPGSKDQVERVAVDWLDMIKRKALDAAPDAFPQEWINSFHAKFDAWKAGHAAPMNGTSVKEWPVLSPSQAENFIVLGILTIEDVSAMTEEALGRVGMGSRELRDKAREWLKGKDATKAIEQENEQLKQQLADVMARLAELEADKPKRGRRAAEPKEE